MNESCFLFKQYCQFSGFYQKSGFCGLRRKNSVLLCFGLNLPLFAYDFSGKLVKIGPLLRELPTYASFFGVHEGKLRIFIWLMHFLGNLEGNWSVHVT